MKYLNSPPPLERRKSVELKIWGEEGTDTGYLKLIRQGDNIFLVIISPDGGLIDGGFLLEITREKKVILDKGISPTLGFKLDSEGRIEIEK